MAHVYVIQFEETLAFSSARRAAEWVRSHYTTFDWVLHTSTGTGKVKLNQLADFELEGYIRGWNFLSLQAGNEEMTIRKVTLNKD